MGMTRILGRLLFLMVIVELGCNAQSQVKVFDVTKYGAIADARKDSTKAFMSAWSDACKWNGKSRILVPAGTFRVGSMVFLGPCKNPISFTLRGHLEAPSNPSAMNSDQWITFRYITGLVVNGGGSLDGQGASSWKYINQNGKVLPISLRFEFVKNGRVNHITSINSKNAHISIFGCENLDVSNVRLSAPGNSPNTDGIKIGGSNRISISRTSIGTGDDCIAILSGTSNLNISEVFCGPGHGISVGSLGKYKDEKNVVGLSVKNCTFKDTTNGLRIKTWSTKAAAIVSGFTFQDIFMNNVQNPIIIDQQYCPYPPCDQQSPSHVQIKDIIYNNIFGTSSTKVAVLFRCSQSFPCKNIVLQDINLIHQGPGGSAISQCAHVNGASHGRQVPPSCL